MSKTIYVLTSALLLCGLIRDLQTAQLVCLKGSVNNSTTATLENPTTLLTSSCFNSSLRTILYAHGFNGSWTGNASTVILSAYVAEQENRWNVVALDWQKEASVTALGIDASYALKAAPNTADVGKKLCEALIKLTEADNCIDLNNVHLVGHSLGAHLMGYTGRCLLASDYLLDRITGLDPASNLFTGRMTPYQKLDRDCASFVEIVHSNAGNYGINETSGTVDFWPNYSYDGLQPGCPKGNFPRLSSNDLCSHIRSILYYAEAIKYTTGFLGSLATNYQTWLNQGMGNVTAYIGENTNTDSDGNYYLTTNNQSLYNKGTVGAYNTQAN